VAARVNAYIERTHARELYCPMLAERGLKNVSESLHFPWWRGLDLAGNKFVDFDDAGKGAALVSSQVSNVAGRTDSRVRYLGRSG